MAAPVLQFKRGLLANLPGLRAGEPGFTTDSYDLYVGIDSTTTNNKFFGSHRYWTRGTATTGSGVNLVEGTNNGSDYVTLKSPDSLAGIVTYTLPGTQGAPSSVLTNNGSGVLTWSSGSSNPVFTGIATFTDTTDNTLGNADTGAVQIDGGLGINKNLTVGANLNVQGYSEFVGVVTFRGGTINLGDGNTDDINVAGEFISNLVPNTNNTYDIGDGGSTKSWRNASFAGIGTFSSGAVLNLVQVGRSTSGEVDTSSGALTLDSATGQTIIDDNLSVTGLATVGSNLAVAGVTTTQHLRVVGFTTIVNESVTGVSTIGTLAVTGVTTTQHLLVTGVSTFSNGPVLIGSGTSTGTANQLLQVTGGASFTGAGSNIGIGTTLPTQPLDVRGNTSVSGVTTTQHLLVTGVTTAVNINATGITTLGTLAVTGVTTTQHLLVTGVTTVTGAFSANGNVTLGDAAGDVITINGTTTFGQTIVGTISTATRASLVSTNTAPAGTFYPGLFVSNTGVGSTAVYVDAGISYVTDTDTLTLTGDIAVNGGDVTTSAATFNLINSNATTVNFGGAATSLLMGAATGVSTVRNKLVVAGNLEVDGNNIQASDGNTNITLTSNTLTTFAGDVRINGNDIQASDGNTNITMTSNTLTAFAGDIRVNGNDIQSSTGANVITLSANNASFANDVTVTGNLYINGSTTQVNTTTLNVKDSLIDVGLIDTGGGVLGAPTSDLNKDIGLLFNYFTASAKKAGVYWDDSVSRIVFADDVTESASVLTPATGGYAAVEMEELWINSSCTTNTSTRVIGCSGSTLILENITIDGGIF